MCARALPAAGLILSILAGTLFAAGEPLCFIPGIPVALSDRYIGMNGAPTPSMQYYVWVDRAPPVWCKSVITGAGVSIQFRDANVNSEFWKGHPDLLPENLGTVTMFSSSVLASPSQHVVTIPEFPRDPRNVPTFPQAP